MAWVGRSDPRSPCVWLLYTSRRTDDSEVAAQPLRQSLHDSEIFHARVTRNIPSEASHYANVELMITAPTPEIHNFPHSTAVSDVTHRPRTYAELRGIREDVPTLDSDNSDLASL